MSDITVEVGTQFIFNVAGDLSPADPATDYSLAGATDVLLTLSAVADTAARQSSKADLGVNRARLYSITVAVDFTGETPSATGQIDYYWAPSTVVTQATANVAGNSGADADAPDGALGAITLLEFLKQCDPIGSLFIHDGAVVQNGFVGRYEMPTQFGQLIVVNNGGDAFENDDVEMHQVLVPVIPDIAAAA